MSELSDNAEYTLETEESVPKEEKQIEDNVLETYDFIEWQKLDPAVKRVWLIQEAFGSFFLFILACIAPVILTINSVLSISTVFNVPVFVVYPFLLT